MHKKYLIRTFFLLTCLLLSGLLYAAEGDLIISIDMEYDNSAGAFLSASIVTDTSDYAPGDSVIITGGGFQPNESVSIDITNVYNPGFGDNGEPWVITADGSGNIETYWIVPDDGVDQTYLATADGLSSGIHAETMFVDASTRLQITVLPVEVCGGTQYTVCAELKERCGGGVEAPLENRAVIFFVNPGNCGANNGGNGDDTVFTNANGIACATFTAPTTPGQYSIRVKFEGEAKPSSGSPGNSACDPTKRKKLSASNDCEDFDVSSSGGNAPSVTINDSTLFFCDTGLICLPVLIEDADCDVDSVTSNLGQYSGTISGYDQLSRINQLGGTVTQIGGGAPGLVLTDASDFVSPINSQSGVAVTLPNFAFADFVSDYGSFPNGIEPGNSADHLLGSPTDLTFTTPGAGGPDGGSGDGSVAFGNGNYCYLGFNNTITTCNGASVDFIIFTNTNGGGTAEINLRKNGSVVYTTTKILPAGSTASGFGGVNFDFPDGIQFDEVKLKSISGTLEIDAIAARTAASSSETDICFTADTAGVYTVIVSATDACNNTGADTAYVTVSFGNPPVANAGADFYEFVCSFSQICFGVSFSDPDNDIILTELISGPGTLAASQICFTPNAAGNYTFVIKATDACGSVDFDTVVVTIDLNNPPVAVQPDSQSLFLCSSEEICDTLAASDPNGGTLNWTLLSGEGAVTAAGVYCLTPIASGYYTAILQVADSCGAADTITVVHEVQINSAPIAIDYSPGIAFQCTPEQICVQLSASDSNGDLLNWSLLSGNGTISTNGLWCFTPSSSGIYDISAIVMDSCGAADTTAMSIDVTINSSPAIVFGNDTTISLCSGDQICIAYDVDDSDGLDNITETMVSGFGTIDTSLNQICYNPTTAGTYEFVVSAEDSCGAASVDTISVTVTLGSIATISCPADTIDINLCDPDSVCQMIAVLPASAVVTPSFGTYAAGQLCFFADTAGIYDVQLIADESCGSDTCNIVFNVVFSSAAQVSCPAPQSIFICEADSVCIPVGVNGSNVSVSVSPVGSFSGGNVCFPADTSGHYEISIIATTNCGSDTCTVVADIVINSAPVAVEPGAAIDTFICANASICYQFTATDSDGGSLIWSKLSGVGTVSPSGQFCFNTAGNGSYSATAVVTDSCGAADTVSVTYNITKNSSPTIAIGNDTTFSICAAQAVCVPYTTSDVDSNIESLVLLVGNGGIDTVNSTICLYPTTSGIYQFVAQVTDSCGAADVDTVNITVEVNSAPVVDAGVDQNLFQCTPTEICLTVAATDVDNNITTFEIIEGSATLTGNQLCFTPTQTFCYEFVLKATDACGLEDVDTVIVCVDMNSAPVANAGPDQTLFQCAPAEICLPAACSDVDGNLTSCTMTTSVGTYNGTSICFTPDTSGLYTFIIEAADACGLVDSDTVQVAVTLNTAPVCSVPNDTTIYMCTLAQVCLPVSGSDSDNNLDYCQIISGPGTLSGGNWCYTPTASQVVSVTVECIDDCGTVCQSTFSIEFKVNHAPTLAFESVAPIFRCESSEICIGFSVDDPDDPQDKTVSLVSGTATIDTVNNELCFTPSVSGDYTFILAVTDDCGASTSDTITVNVTLNSAPVITMDADQTINLCLPEEICFNASIADVNSNITGTNFTGPGTFNGSTICFTPTVSGDYQFILYAEDACDASVADTLNVTVVLNNAPAVVFDAASDADLCVPTEICLTYTPADADGLSSLIERMVSGFGTIDTLNNRICFTPTTAGTYEFTVEVEDSCGAISQDVVSIDVTFGASAQITCPANPIEVNLCAADQVCQMITVTPASATVTPSFGTFANGELCFNADTSGTYTITLIADESCGSDTCEVVFDVFIGTSVTISCPAPQSEFLCEADSVCIPVSINGTGLTVTVSPFGTYQAGNICFPADTSGHYEISVVASAACGADSCVVVVDVDINANPIADIPVSPIDTFTCSAGEICYQFSASDINGGGLTWSRLSGNGTVTSSGLWCFSATGDNSYTVQAVVIDACGAADTVTLTYNIDQNSPPVIAYTAKAVDAVKLCGPEELCYPYTATDIDGNLVLEELISGSGTIDTIANTVCFTPDTAGTYRFIISATDACNLTDLDTLDVTVSYNTAPIVNAGADNTFSLCDASEVCWGVSCLDADNNLDSCYVVSGAGTYSNSSICFTPDTAGTYIFVLRAVDLCGEADQDTVQITVGLNVPPICMVPNDTTIFQCAPSEITLPIGSADPDGNFDHCELLTGPGSIVNGNWVYTPTANQSVMVTVMCLDSCGASCIDTFNVVMEVNSAPLVSGGDDFTQFLCSIEQVCFPISYSDVNNNIETVELLTPTGNLNLGTDEICFTPDATDGKKYTFILRAVDSCGVETFDTTYVTIEYNAPPSLDLPPSFVVYLDEIGEICFAVSSDDPDDNLTGITVSPIGSYNAGSDEICFMADSTGEYCLDVTATDACGEMVTYNICINIQIDECFLIQLDRVHNALQGRTTTVNVNYDGSAKEIGGFDLLIAYDQTALSVANVLPGSLLEDCGWEYFTYRLGADGNCGNGCPSGILRVVGIAETNNGGYHPSCFLYSVIGDLVNIEFLVSNDRTLECMEVPVQFLWLDCGDNTLSSRLGDTLWTSRDIFTYENNVITNTTFGFPGYYGAHDDCLIGGGAPGKYPIRCVDFTNGAVKIVCADSIDGVADLNLNEVAYEIADAVLYSNYFVYGLSVFTVNLEGQIAASDVNKDGLTLSVADLVYLIRVIVGDAQQYPKLIPGYHPEAEFKIQNNRLMITRTDEKIGAVSLKIEGEAKPELIGNAVDMQIHYNFDGENTNVLIFSLDGKAHLEEGQILKLSKNRKIKEVDIGSYNGYVMTAKVSALPDKYELSQNYPNPFNPVTTINFALPQAAEWNLTIYNVLGQVVDRFENKSEAGYISLEWDASKYASGLYFYRLRAGEFSDTKKMVLLK